MDVISSSPLPVASVVWQPKAGAFALTAVCRATFLLRPGIATLAPEQEPPNLGDVHWDDDPSRSVWAPSDRAPAKPRADVVVVGSAFAPGKGPARKVVARIAVGEIDKAIEVSADRVIRPDGSVQEGPGFTQMPLVYELAAGGPSSWNPVGVSGDTRDAAGLVVVPNLTPPGAGGAAIEPIGFGPIAAGWPGRMEKLGRHAAAWSHVDWPRQPLPDDLDLAHFNVAPPDQQITALREDEAIVLENLHPDHPRLVTRLPGVRPTAILEGRSGLRVLQMRCDTLWIDTDRGLCTVTWRVQVALERTDEAGSLVVGVDPTTSSGIKLPAAEPTAAAERPGADLLHTIAVTSAPSGAALPWKESSSAAGAGRAAPRMTALPFRSSRTTERPAAPAKTHLTQVLLNAPPAPPPRPAPPPPARPIAAATPPPPVPPPAALAPPPAPPSKPAQGMTVGQLAAAEVAARGPKPPPPPARPIAAPPPPPPSKAAAPQGALAASNAAVQVEEVKRPSSDAAPASAPRAAAAATGEIVELLWFEPRALPRMRARWPELVLELDFEAIDPRHDLPDEDPAAAKDRHVAFGVLTGASVIDPAGVRRAIAEAVGDKGRFTPPLVLVSGELRFPFDELEALKATASVISPLVGADNKKLKESIDAVGELLKTPYLQSSTGVVDKLAQQLKDQLAQSNRSLPAGHVDALVERILLEQRRYQIRKVLGEEWIRALLGAGREAPPVPVYLPRALEHRLPMMTTLRARLVAEAHLRQEQFEGSEVALKVAAVGRVASLGARGG
jgi:hypothetical protein